MPAGTAQGQLPMPPLQTYVALSFLFLAWDILQAKDGLVLLETMQADVGQDRGSGPGADVSGLKPDTLHVTSDPINPADDRDPVLVASVKDSFEDSAIGGYQEDGIKAVEVPSDTLGSFPHELQSTQDKDPISGGDTPLEEKAANMLPDGPMRSPDDDIGDNISGGTPFTDPDPVEGSLGPKNEGSPEQGQDKASTEGGGAGESGEAEQEDLFQTLMLDMEISPDDSDTVKILKIMLQDSLSVMVIINSAVCCLVLLGKAIQYVVFGELRVIERQHLKDKLWNFSFYKLIVVFGVLNVQTLWELVFWVGWFAILAFLHGFAQLCKDRFEYLSFSPATPTKTHSLVITLLGLILGVTGGLMAGSFYLCYQYDWNLLFFMMAECILVAVRAVYVLSRYSIHLYDMHHEGVWEYRGSYIYYTELVLELVTLSLDFVHHLHMLLWVNVFLSMASLLICMQLRHLYYEIQRRVQRHRNYRRVVANMEARFPKATEEELVANDDDCAICWEELKGARKLPCGHLFHDACLRSWLEHETSCPTCRQSLNIQTTPSRPPRQRMPAMGARPQGPNLAMMGGGEARPPRQINRRNHLFHFDGSRIFSWLPSFSVEVTHAHVMGPQEAHTSQLDNMARQVRSMFPNVPYPSIQEDLRNTRSIELTVDNILEGRLAATVEMGGENTPNANQGGAAAAQDDNTFPAFIPNETDQNNDNEGGLLYRQTRQAGEGLSLTSTSTSAATAATAASTSDMTAGMEGSEDNAANWRRPDNSISNTVGSSAPSDTIGGFPVYSSRFSKSSAERETILRQRKEKLLQLARRKFQERQQREAESQRSTLSQPGSSSSSSAALSSLASSSSSPSLSSLDPSVSSSSATIGAVNDQRSTDESGAALRQRSAAHLQPGAQLNTTSMAQTFNFSGAQSEGERQRLRAAALEAALRRLQQQQRPL